MHNPLAFFGNYACSHVPYIRTHSRAQFLIEEWDGLGVKPCLSASGHTLNFKAKRSKLHPIERIRVGMNLFREFLSKRLTNVSGDRKL
jgi:hypothetical protein